MKTENFDRFEKELRKGNYQHLVGVGLTSEQIEVIRGILEKQTDVLLDKKKKIEEYFNTCIITRLISNE
jgi:hypothetical protein